MLFPHEPVRALTERDHWLINRYRLPARRDSDGMLYFPVLDDLDDNRILAPNELIAEVDRAYFRLSLQNEVDEWFTRRGFDPEQRTISKEEFEKRLADYRAAPKSSQAAAAISVKNYFASTSHPTMDGCEDACKSAAPRKWVRKYYRIEAKNRGISAKKGPRGNSAK